MSFPPKQKPMAPSDGDGDESPIGGMVKNFVKKKKGGFPPKKGAPPGKPPFPPQGG